jgi:hypothetical protein
MIGKALIARSPNSGNSRFAETRSKSRRSLEFSKRTPMPACGVLPRGVSTRRPVSACARR